MGMVPTQHSKWHMFPLAAALPLSPQVLRTQISQVCTSRTQWDHGSFPRTLQRPTLLSLEMEEGSVCS